MNNRIVALTNIDTIERNTEWINIYHKRFYMSRFSPEYQTNQHGSDVAIRAK